MKPIKQNFKFTRGDDVRQPFKLLNWNIEGMTLRMSVRDEETNEVKFELSTADGTIEIFGEGKYFRLKFTNAMTQGLEIRPLVYDLELINLQGERTTIMKGSINLWLDYTR